MLVVTSVYKDSYQDILNFTLQHNLQLLVYNKNDSLSLGQEIITHSSQQLTIIDIPNYGRCDYSFLYYIVTNYKNLPEKVLFTKANFMYEGIQIQQALNNNNFMLVGKVLKYGILNNTYDKNNLHKLGINKD